MRLDYSPRFLRAYAAAPARIQRIVDKQIAYLIANLRHPSLRAKKYDAAQDIWQARITQDWRLYFQITGPTYVLLDVKPHPK